VRRALLLAAQIDQSTVLGVHWPMELLDHDRWLQYHILSDALQRTAGHAAASLYVSARLRARVAEPRFHGRCVRARAGSAGVPGELCVEHPTGAWTRGGSQPLGCGHA